MISGEALSLKKQVSEANQISKFGLGPVLHDAQRGGVQLGRQGEEPTKALEPNTWALGHERRWLRW